MPQSLFCGSLLIAILINRPMKARGFFRTVFFIPVLLGSGYVICG